MFRFSSFLMLYPFNSRPHKEVDETETAAVDSYSSFNSRPHKEVDAQDRYPNILHLSFNSRPHKEVDGAGIGIGTGKWPFNSRPHKEVDFTTDGNTFLMQLFQFTTSQGGRLSQGYQLFMNYHFQFTTSQGGRRICGNIHPADRSFNSRPHKEVDHRF